MLSKVGILPGRVIISNPMVIIRGMWPSRWISQSKESHIYAAKLAAVLKRFVFWNCISFVSNAKGKIRWRLSFTWTKYGVSLLFASSEYIKPLSIMLTDSFRIVYANLLEVYQRHFDSLACLCFIVVVVVVVVVELIERVLSDGNQFIEAVLLICLFLLLSSKLVVFRELDCVFQLIQHFFYFFVFNLFVD